MKKKVRIIINPASGKKDSILWSINNAFQKKDVAWEIAITKQKGDAYALAQDAVKKKIPYVAVYGGDGTVSEVAKALIHTATPLAIIPGGTANVFAKELGITTNVDEALQLISREKDVTKTIDMGFFQKTPFVLRIEIGLAAHIVKDTKRETKRLLGQFSYIIHSVTHLHHEQRHTFTMNIDGKEITEKGIALMIANVGNIGIEGYSIVPQSKIDDGLLDVVIVKEKGIGTFVTWFTHILARKKPERIITHWKAKTVDISLHREHTIICDDVPMKAKSIHAEVVPQSLHVIVP